MKQSISLGTYLKCFFWFACIGLLVMRIHSFEVKQ